jgi:hypothetical protein
MAYLAVLIVVVSLGLPPSVARGGGDTGEFDDDIAAAERAARSWRRQGPRALPKVIKALCTDHAWLGSAAQGVLVAWGPYSVKPLLDTIAKDVAIRDDAEPCGDPPVSTLGRMFCHAGRPAADSFLAPSELDDPDVVARVKRTLRTMLGPVVAALSRKKEPLAGAALSAVYEVATAEASDCPNRRIVLDMTAGPTVELLDSAKGEDKEYVVKVLSKLGPAAGAAVPRAVALLADPTMQSPTIRLLGAIGPASAPAVPALRLFLTSQHAAAASIALGEIGAHARAALPDLIALLERVHRSGCDQPLPISALAEPIAKLGAAGHAEASSAVQILIASLQMCPRFEQDLVTAIGFVGPHGSAAAPTLRAIMKDEARPLDRRLRASGSLLLLGTTITKEENALIVAMEHKSHQLDEPSMENTAQFSERPAPMTPAQKQQHDVDRAIGRAEYQITFCRAEVGLPPLDGKVFRTPPPTSGDVGALARLASCLGDRVCGPTQDGYIRSVRHCCTTAFGNKPPSWCTAP